MGHVLDVQCRDGLLRRGNPLKKTVVFVGPSLGFHVDLMRGFFMCRAKYERDGPWTFLGCLFF